MPLIIEVEDFSNQDATNTCIQFNRVQTFSRIGACATHKRTVRQVTNVLHVEIDSKKVNLHANRQILHVHCCWQTALARLALMRTVSHILSQLIIGHFPNGGPVPACRKSNLLTKTVQLCTVQFLTNWVMKLGFRLHIQCTTGH